MIAAFNSRFCRYLAGAVTFNIALVSQSALADTPSSSRWEPILEISDEFNGTELDMMKWDNFNRSYPGKKPGFYARENVQVRGGMLELWARAKDNASVNGGYTVAYVGGKRQSLYGYFEVRAKPMSARINSSFWLYRWTPTGTYEVDVFEIFATSPGHEQSVHTNAHAYHGDPSLESDQNRRSEPFTWLAPHPLGTDFHVYGFEWNKSELRFYFDNRLVRSKPNTDWHEAMFVRFTAETHQDWGGLPTRSELPAAFLVDYFRAWRAVRPDPVSKP